MDLSPEVVVELKEAERQYRIRSRGAGIVSSRMVSRKELTDKLERRGATEEEAADTADWLEDLGALNDEAYAAAVARHYGRMGYGKLRVRQELRVRTVLTALESRRSKRPPPTRTWTPILFILPTARPRPLP